MLEFRCNNKYNQTYTKQGTKGVYTQETPEGEIPFNQTILVCVSIVQLGPFI